MKQDKTFSELERKVDLGLKKAYEKMVQFKKQNNSPLIISKNGSVTSIPAKEISPTTTSKNEF